MAQITSKEAMRAEIIKCGRDPVYFLKNYAKIAHPVRGLIPFKTFDYQDELLKDLKENRFNIVLKARQLGISTVTAGYIAWFTLFHREKNVLIMATKLSSATNMVTTAKKIIDYLPDWLMVADVTVDNRTSFELSNGSKCKATATSKDAGRSEALSLMVVDEAAFVDEMEELWTGLAPTINAGGSMIAMSTPNGATGWFHRIFKQSEIGENNFKSTILHWTVHPEHDQAWFEKETKGMTKRQIDQEFMCDFLSSGETVIRSEDIKEMREATSEPKYKTYIDRNYHIWDQYKQDKTYLICADSARGDGEDFSVFHVLNVDDMEQVAEYRGKIDMESFANLLISTGKEYGNCMIVVENNNIGFTVCTKIVDKGYPNVYHATKGSHEFADPLYESNNVIPGFTTTQKNRPLIIAKLEEYVRNKLLKINSIRTIVEFESFIWHNGRPEARKDYHDDLIISLAIGCWVRDTVLITSDRNSEYTKVFLTSMTKTNTMMQTDIGYLKDLQRKSDTNKNIKTQQQYQEFYWLYKG